MSTIFDDFFDELYRENYVNLVKYAYRLTYEKNFAEEIVQDAFTEAYKKRNDLRQHANPTGWLYLTVKNIAKAYLREYRDIKDNIPLHEIDGPVIESESDERFLNNYLSDDDTQIILRFYKEKCSITEISDLYGISISACKMRLKRARDRLKKNYSKIIL